jgi:vacuolar-type H+-ATPase subunit E/Vma4
VEIETIITGIQHAGKKQMEQIIRETDLQISKIEEAAQDNANLQKQRIISIGQAQLQRDQALITQQAIMECLQIHADSRQVLIEKTLDAVKKQFNKIRHHADYAKIFKALVEEAISSIKPSLFEGQLIILHIDPKDKTLFEGLEFIKLSPYSLVYDIACWGGCNAETEDGLVQVFNTINSRFEHALPFIQMQLSLYFEERTRQS